MTKSRDYNSINWNNIFIDDPASPTHLTWKINKSRSVKAGDIAGFIQVSKYGKKRLRVGVNLQEWFVHRILYAMRNGQIDPYMEVDHIDGNSLNNSVENLRLVSGAVNSRNNKRRTDNSSGKTGVCFWLNHQGDTYAKARFSDLNGNVKSKSFSVSKYGLLEAFNIACNYRDQKIEELNTIGAGYSERHGT